ncbi:hypothetical protein D3C81_1504360 [compost metagenome]
MDDHEFGQTTWQGRTEAIVGLVGAWRAVDPARIQVRIDALAHLETAHAGAHGHHHAGGVGHGNQGLGHHVRLVDAIDNRLVAEVERDGAHFYQQLARLRHGRRHLCHLQIVQAEIL